MPLAGLSRRFVARAGLAAASFAVLDRSARAEPGTIRVGGTGAALGGMTLVGQAFAESRLQVVPSLGSSGGLKALTAGKLDVAVSARDLKPEERAAGLLIRPYARTPFLAVTSRQVGPVELSMAQLAAMVGGEVAEWPDRMPVRLVLRPTTESDTIQLAAFHPKMPAALEAARKRPGTMEADTDQAAADALEQLQGSLGTSTLSLLMSEDRALQALTLDGAVPMMGGRAQPGYPHRKTLYIAWRPDASGPTRAFVSFLDGARGQEVLANVGHMTLHG